MINQYDDAWSDLVIWKDANEDGVTDTGELQSLASLGIVSFDLAGVAASASTISGNAISHTSTYTLSGGSTRAVADAWFVHDNVNSTYAEDFTLDARTLFLPTLRGFGELADLHIAMSEDEDLLELVHDFVGDWNYSRFEDSASLDADVSAIMFTWAGVDGVSSTSRGPSIDARRLEFMEQYFGQEFTHGGFSTDPGEAAAAMLNGAWDILLGNIKAQLLAQSGAASVFGGTIGYDAWAGELSGDMDLLQSAIDDIETAAPSPGPDLVSYWLEVATFIAFTKGVDNLSGGEEVMLDDAIVATDATLSWEEIKTEAVLGLGSVINGTVGNDTLYGTAFDDEINTSAGTDIAYGDDGDDEITSGGATVTYYGEAGDDELYGHNNADMLDGGTGNDLLYGYSGNDTLRPGAGGDVVYGGYGNDVYEYTNGNDFYEELGDYAGSDKVSLASGITSGDLSFSRVLRSTAVDSLVITIDGYGSIETPYFTSSGYVTSNGYIETIEFSNASTYSVSGLTAMTTYGTAGNNTIYGLYLSSHLNDTIYGLDGDDTIDGQSGNDTLDGGEGNDTLYGNYDDDVYVASPGFDYILDYGGSDTIMLPAGFDAGDITFLRMSAAPYAVELRIDGLGQIKIDAQLGYGAIETISFNGASTLSMSTVQLETLGTSSGDTLNGISSGASTNDLMDGRAGNDTLNGEAGNDTYFFSLGTDTIGEQSGTDTISFREGWIPANVSVYRTSDGTNGTKLVVEDSNGNKTSAGQHFTIEGGSSNANYTIEQIVFADSTTWTLASMEIVTKGSASADTILGTTAGDASNADTIYGYGGADVVGGGDGADAIYGGDGNDSLDGDGGNDLLVGEAGDDTLTGDGGDDVFISGIGLDTIYDMGGGTDTLHVAGGITINDMSIANEGGSSARIVITASVNEILVQYLRSPGYDVELIRFDDGFTTSLPDYNGWLNGTSGNDVVAGSGSDETLIGFAGNDTITGGAGNDDAHGGAGADSLDGGDGTDLLYGGDGDDTLYGKAGLDTLHGGAGADTFVFETASAFSNVDVIRDFSAANDDVLDLTDILDAVYNPLTDAIADFVSFGESSGSTFVSVDRDGTAGVYSMAQIVKLEGLTGLASPETLETNGNLLAA